MKKHLIWGLILISGLATAADVKEELEQLSAENNSTEEQFELSKSAKSYGSNRYGNGDRFICESYRGQRQHCEADTSGGVRLIRQIGYNSCRGNWGYDYYGVWVTNGCRGEFQVDRYQDYYGRVDDIIRCESYSYRRQTCARDLRGAEVSLIHQLSNRSCRGNWGFNYNEVWVSNGCKADFLISHQNQGNNPNYPGYQGGLLECRSQGTSITHCQVPDLQSIELVEEMGQYRNSCRGNWGYSSHGVWVANGCHAQFKVTEYYQEPVSPGYGNQPQPPVREKFEIKCKSRNNKLKICDTRGPFRDVEFKREISKGKYPCEGNWGVNKHGELFVANNCYAEFMIYK